MEEAEEHLSEEVSHSEESGDDDEEEEVVEEELVNGEQQEQQEILIPDGFEQLSPQEGPLDADVVRGDGVSLVLFKFPPNVPFISFLIFLFVLFSPTISFTNSLILLRLIVNLYVSASV